MHKLLQACHSFMARLTVRDISMLCGGYESSTVAMSLAEKKAPNHRRRAVKVQSVLLSPTQLQVFNTLVLLSCNFRTQLLIDH